MTLRLGFVLGGIAALIAGTLRVAAAWQTGLQGLIEPELLYFIIDAGFLFGTVALYMRHADALGIAGLAGFVPALFGVALILGPDVPLMGYDLYATGSTLFAAGMALLAAVSLFNRTEFGGAHFFLGAFALGVAAQFVPGVPYHYEVAGTLFGLGFVMAGVQLVRG
ncbi:MAG TPA: hypothetical protein PL096_04965 [Micropepsaceae bacterium]|nr:hypothetical protein [Micropepsaceae bacterium]